MEAKKKKPLSEINSPSQKEKYTAEAEKIGSLQAAVIEKDAGGILDDLSFGKADGINTTALAYIGDAVFEIYVREYVISAGNYNVDTLHKAAVKYVKADAQAHAIKTMLMAGNDPAGEAGFALTEDEISLVKRARNHKIASKAKNADPMDYKYATAFEALIGYHHISGNREREKQLAAMAISVTNGRKSKQGEIKK